MEVLRGRRGTSRSRPSCGKKEKHESHQERSNKCTEERARVLMYNVVIHVSHPLVVASQRGRSTLPGGGLWKFPGLSFLFFLFTSKTRFVLSSPTASRQNLYSDLLQDLRSGAMTLATPIDRLSVKARARGSEGTQTVEPRSGERDPAPRRATPTSEVKVRLTDTCRHARHHVFFSLEEGGGLESAPRGYGAGEATSAHLRHGVRRLREGGGGLVDLEARTKNRCVFWRGTSTSRPQ